MIGRPSRSRTRPVIVIPRRKTITLLRLRSCSGTSLGWMLTASIGLRNSG